MNIRAALIVAVALLSLPTHAAQHAVLVGVSAYDNLPPYQHLRGPANDVQLLRDVLLARGFPADNIAVIADNVDGGIRPTRAAIMGALDALINAAGPGDFVFVHFSGHGTQQPAIDDERESDGYDEVFLPIDTDNWNDEQHTIENAIVDDEIGDRLTRIRRRGAFVWAMFDTCHSGTMTRGGFGERQRSLDPVAALGVPTSPGTTRSRSAGSPIDGSGLTGEMGGSVAFYASQSLETTPELYLPPRSAERRPHGLFTYNVAKVLANYRDISYRQAAEQVLRNYAVMNRFRPTPVFEGELDARVFSSDEASRVRQYALHRKGKTLRLAAGRLHLLETGAVLAVVPEPTSRHDEVIGYVEVTSATATSSDVVPLTYAGADRPVLSRLPAVSYARLIEPQVNFVLLVGVLEGEKQASLRSSLRRAVARDGLGERVRLVRADESVDLVVEAVGGSVHFRPIGANAAQDGPLLSLELPPEELERELARTLRRVAKAVNLIRLSDYIPHQNNTVRLRMAITSEGEPRELPAHEIARLAHGDELEFAIENAGYRPVDVTLLFVDSNYEIHVLYPRTAGELNRIPPRATDRIRARVDTSDSAGRERLVMLAVAAGPHMPVNDFSFLASELDDQEQASRGSRIALGALLHEAGFGGHATRGITRAHTDEIDDASISILTWQTR